MMLGSLSTARGGSLNVCLTHCRPSASVRKLASEPPLVPPLLLPPPPPSIAMQPPVLVVPEVKVENGPFETTRSGRVRLPRLAFWCNQSVRKASFSALNTIS